MKASSLALALAALTGVAPLVACGGVLPHSREAGAVGTLAVRPVEWNPSRADVGAVSAVADAGNVVAVFAQGKATVLSSGAVVATDHAVPGWVDADTIYGADGSPSWIVGIGADGNLYYLRNQSSFENVSARYGLDVRRVRGAAVLGPGWVGFLLDQEIALADGRRVTRYGAGSFAELTGGGGFGAALGGDRIDVFTAAQKSVQRYALTGATHVALDTGGRLYATTARAVYAADEKGELALVYDALADTVHGLVVSREHVWFADGSELGVLDAGRVAETSGAHLAPDAKLAASSSGDVWVIAGTGLQRFARVDPEPALAAVWGSTLQPIFARSCAECHLPTGVSGTDLSTAEAWHTERDAIHQRVVVAGTMPPQGHALSEADRAAIKSWTEAK
jgi:mono/diheme cytochrome c family protein